MKQVDKSEEAGLLNPEKAIAEVQSSPVGVPLHSFEHLPAMQLLVMRNAGCPARGMRRGHSV